MKFRARGVPFETVVVSILACACQPAGEHSCASDTDCKGSRVCVDGACEEPATANTSSSGGNQTSSSRAPSTGTTQQPLTAGSRLQVKRLVGADGSTRQIGFHDQTLDIDCDFIRTEAGDFLCAPVSGAGLLDPSAARTFGQYYADPACAEPLVSSDLGLDKLKYIVDGRGATAFVDVAVLGRVLAPGAEYLGNLSFKQSPTAGTCGVYARANTHYYRYGSDVNLSTFAAATVSVEQ